MEMDKIPVKYNTTCMSKKTGAILMERVYEAASKDEAETRAFLNCVKAGNKLDEVEIGAEKI